MKTSDKIDKILEKLFAAKTKIGIVTKDKNNPFHNSKYADVNNFIEVCEPILWANGILLLQPTDCDDRGQYVETKLVDINSGQFVSSRLHLLLAKQDMQSLGSAITYARRYTLQSLLAMQAEDDDGNIASGYHRETVTAKMEKPIPQVIKTQSKDIVENICEACGGRMMVSKYNPSEWYCSNCRAKKPRSA